MNREPGEWEGRGWRKGTGRAGTARCGHAWGGNGPGRDYKLEKKWEGARRPDGDRQGGDGAM